MAYTFDGLNKLIILSTGTVEVTVKDMYSSWKSWMTNGDNSKYLPAFSVLGGDDLPGGRFLGSTFFLENGWKIRPFEGNHTLTVTGNLYARDGSDPFVSTLGTYNVKVLLSVSNLVDTVNISGGTSTAPSANQVAEAVWNHATAVDSVAKVNIISKILRNKAITDPVTGKMTIYDDDGSVLLVANVFEDKSGLVPYRGKGAERRERFE